MAAGSAGKFLAADVVFSWWQILIAIIFLIPA